MDKDDEIVCYILMRSDLGMSPGKMVAQGGHAVHLMLEEVSSVMLMENKTDNTSKWYNIWSKDGITKIALGATEQEINDVLNQVESNAYIIKSVIDEGRTEIPANSLTAACLQPMPRKLAKQFVGHLKLL